MTFDGSGRMTAQEIADVYGERVVAGSSQVDDRAREVFPTFMTRRYYGAYNWQTATYEVTTRAGGQLVRPRATRSRASRT